MKISQEHIGKKVRKLSEVSEHWIKDTYVGNKHFLGVDSFGFDVCDERYGNWELVEEPKKPSERISELFRGLVSTEYDHLNDIRVLPAMQYLYKYPLKGLRLRQALRLIAYTHLNRGCFLSLPVSYGDR